MLLLIICKAGLLWCMLSAGDIEVPLLVHFVAPDNKALAIPPIALILSATGKEVPVSTLTPLIDFK